MHNQKCTAFPLICLPWECHLDLHLDPLRPPAKNWIKWLRSQIYYHNLGPPRFCPHLCNTLSINDEYHIHHQYNSKCLYRVVDICQKWGIQSITLAGYTSQTAKFEFMPVDCETFLVLDETIPSPVFKSTYFAKSNSSGICCLETRRV